MDVSPAFMPVYHVCAWFLEKPEKGIKFPGTGAIDGRVLPYGCWELDLGPLVE